MIKRMMIKGMDAVMLNCEEATYLVTKSEMSQIGCLKTMQLKMHLVGCELCRRFKMQSVMINKSLEKLEQHKIQTVFKEQKLSVSKKQQLEELINAHL